MGDNWGIHANEVLHRAGLPHDQWERATQSLEGRGYGAEQYLSELEVCFLFYSSLLLLLLLLFVFLSFLFFNNSVSFSFSYLFLSPPFFSFLLFLLPF